MSKSRRRATRVATAATVVAAVSGVASITPTPPAGAYDVQECGNWVLHFSYNGDSTVDIPVASAQSSDHANASLASLAEWQGFSGSPFRFSGSSGAHLAIYTTNAGNVGYDGVTTSSCHANGLVMDTWSGYNTYYTSGYADPKKQSVMVHELGHSLGLGHAGSLANCTNLPVMFYTTSTRYDTCGKKTPQTDDINGIWAIY